METTKPATETVEAQPTGQRFRFSILTIFLITAIVGLALAYSQSRSQLLDVRDELTQTRKTYELLNVTDDSQIYVRPLRVPAEKMWQWRVYLPEGAQYQIKYDYNSIPPKDPKPTTRTSLTLSPGHYVITQMFANEPDHHIAKWRSTLSAIGPHANTRVVSRLMRNDVRWLDAKVIGEDGRFLRHVLTSDEDGTSGERVTFRITPEVPSLSALHYSQIECAADQPVELLRWEVLDYEPERQSDLDFHLPFEIFRLWIEREPPPKPSP
ncbi:hypothetical protein [Bremerella alba]|uniref:Uncharacterized protein n=1 Tax=Bremerella alba TaxID=980252 RepID=A0A7V9A9Z1_9BACT|nr:hypothetical protein [Bremerella alba]MBA2117636.1 hypothetical protein [Bremerella alba]